MKHTDRGARLTEGVFFRRPDAVKMHISEAACKRTQGGWLPPDTRRNPRAGHPRRWRVL